MSPRARIILAAVAAVLLCVAVFFFVIKPKREGLARARADVTAENDRTIQLTNELEHLQSLQAQAPRFEALLTRIRQLVPKSNEVPAFIFEVQRAANQSGVGFVSITPELPATPPEGAQLAEVRTTIGASGGYFAVQDFMRRLVDLPRALRIDNIAMIGATNAATGATTITLELAARIFYELPSSAASTGAPATTGAVATPAATPSPTP